MQYDFGSYERYISDGRAADGHMGWILRLFYPLASEES